MDFEAPVSVAEVAELFGVHRHTVEGWTKDGLSADRPSGVGGPVLLKLREVVRFVVERERKRASDAIAKAREGSPDEDSSKARKLRAEARLKELNVAERERKLVPAAEVEEAWSQQIVAVRESVMSTAGQLVQTGLVRPDDERKVDEILRDALVSAVRKLEETT